jgi:hypothetical protein
LDLVVSDQAGLDRVCLVDVFVTKKISAFQKKIARGSGLVSLGHPLPPGPKGPAEKI